MLSARTIRRVLIAIAAVAALSGWRAFAQATVQPINDRPNPYQTTADDFKLPAVRTWGSTSAAEGVAVDARGNIYGAEVGPKAVKKYVKK